MKLLLQLTGFGLFLGIYGYILSHVLPKRYYSLVNLLVSLGSLGFGIWVLGLSLGDVGLSPEHLLTGLLVGVMAGTVVIGAAFGLSYIPMFRQYFTDKPKLKPGHLDMLGELLWRIPFGTALSEEILFRGVVLGMLVANSTAAVIVSAGLFGLWHIAPTLRNFRDSPSLQRLVDSDLRFGGHIVATVLVTAFAGVVFALLRVWTGSLLAPWLVHVALNSGSLAVGYFWLHRQKSV